MTATHITAPDGSLWQLVPVEPAAEMQTAAAACWDYWQNGHVINAMWPDMLAAAPEFGGVAVGRMLITEATEGWVDNVELTEAGRQLPPGEYRIYAHPPAADEAMGRDAARYRWLRDEAAESPCGNPCAYRFERGELPVIIDGVSLDAAIDAAMRQERGE